MPTEFHPLLRRQLQRQLGGTAPPAGLEALLAAVDGAYRAAEQDRAQLERTMERSSRELIEANADLRALLRAFPDTLLWIDAADTVVRVHTDESVLAAGHWTGHKAVELPDRAAAEALGATLAAVRATGRIDDREFELGGRCFEARLLPLGDSRVLAIVRDVTARRQVEASLQQAKEAAVTAAKAKGDFLAMMSHEIRTPLNAILGMTSLLECTRVDHEQREFLGTLRLAGETLLSLVNDILDYSKLEAGKLRLEEIEFSVRECAADAVALMAGTARSKALELAFVEGAGLPATVSGDPTRLRQVLLNLIGNAVKFTERGRVTVRVLREGDAKRADDRVRLRFEVQDTGIGITGEESQHLFQPFTQADGSTTRRYGGTGLGLAICKRVVESMGGEIGFHSDPGAGTTFWFTMAFRTATARKQVQPAPSRRANPVSRGSVLVVEDNEVNQRVAQRMLERLGYDVELAAGGPEALEVLAARSFDLILMDCQMPGMDGWETTRALRARERGDRTPVIAFTANVVDEDLARCQAAGMDDCVTKPASMEALEEVLRKWVAQPSAVP